MDVEMNNLKNKNSILNQKDTNIEERRMSFTANNSIDVSMAILQEVDILSSEKPKNKEEV